MTNPFVLYRMSDIDGALLYVGATTNPSVRFQDHENNKAWWDEVVTISIERFATADELGAAERQAIETEGAKYNVIHSPLRIVAKKPRRSPGDSRVFFNASSSLWVGKAKIPSADGKYRYKAVASKDRDTAIAKLAALRKALTA